MTFPTQTQTKPTRFQTKMDPPPHSPSERASSKILPSTFLSFENVEEGHTGKHIPIPANIIKKKKSQESRSYTYEMSTQHQKKQQLNQFFHFPVRLLKCKYSLQMRPWTAIRACRIALALYQKKLGVVGVEGGKSILSRCAVAHDSQRFTFLFFLSHLPKKPRA